MIDPEKTSRNLWASVITQAVNDATANSGPHGFELDRMHARNWLTDNSADFQHVCAMADVDPDWIRENAERKIEAFDANRSKPVVAKTQPFSEKAITWRGTTLSIDQWAERTGLKVETLRRRLKDGWTISATMLTQVHKQTRLVAIRSEIKTPVKVVTPKKPRVGLHTFNGQTITLKEWAKHLNISVCTLKNRLARKVPPEWPFSSTPLINRHSPTYEYKGERLTRKQWCKRLGMNRDAFVLRLSRYTLADIIEGRAIIRQFTPPSIASPKPSKVKAAPKERLTLKHEYTFNGQTMTLKAWSKALGINYTTLHGRLATGMTIEQAFDPKSRRGANDTLLGAGRGEGSELHPKTVGPAGDRNSRSLPIEILENQDSTS
jgi:AraC-like DNA-binding protein